jgi:quercetin dioxygenase-like cupin family protein
MKMKAAWFVPLCLLPALARAQTPSVITMDQEPHHHLALQNGFVKVFNVEVEPGDSIVLHRHDQDTVAIAIGEQVVTVGVPGKPDVHQKNADAQVRLQRSGYTHSTRVDGGTPYHTVAVELLHPQTSFHNLCAAILPDQPLNCPAPSGKDSSTQSSLPLLESKETNVRLVRVAPRQSMTLASSSSTFLLVVALDSSAVTSLSSKEREKALRPGDFVWLEGGSAHAFRNDGDKEARLIEFTLPSLP